jgi:hypothetical protein
LLKFGGDVAFIKKLSHTDFQVDISNGDQMADGRGPKKAFFKYFGKSSFFFKYSLPFAFD